MIYFIEIGMKHNGISTFAFRNEWAKMCMGRRWLLCENKKTGRSLTKFCHISSSQKEQEAANKKNTGGAKF